MLKSWQQQGLRMFPISINFSRLTMLEHDIVPKLLAVCERHGVLPELINIEVTESIGLMETQELQELIHSLHEAGFSISLDDFGSEYSNMSLLTSMQFDEVKLDRSLISHLDSNNNSRIVTTHVIQMCQDLDFSQSVAEGIETADQHSMLAQMNCTVGQGYYFDKPMPLEAFMAKYMTAQPN